MLIDQSAAIKAIDKFAGVAFPPALHPAYLIADSKREPGLEPVFFLYREAGEMFYHGLLKGKVLGTNYFDLQSPYGYGGPIVTTQDPEFIKRACGAYANWCEESNILVEFVRFHPLAENWLYYSGEVVQDRQTVWIDLTVEDLLMSYGTRARTAVRKAIKEGLSVQWFQGRALAADFEKLYSETMSRLNAGRSYFFSPHYFGSLLEWGGAWVAVCLKDESPVAMALFLTGNKIMEYHLSASTEAGRRHSATNLIIHEAADFAQKLKYQKLHLGGGTDRRPENPLFFFKSGFSESRADFKIGKTIYKRDIYESIRKEYCQKYSRETNRILFYR